MGGSDGWELRVPHPSLATGGNGSRSYEREPKALQAPSRLGENPRLPQSSAASLPAGPTGADQPLSLVEHTTTVAGHTMHSLQAGHGSPLILLHGLLGAAVCWRPAMASLALCARVYAVDAIGMGASARVAGLDASLEASAERLRSFMDTEGIERADLCASSHGGAVAMFFAATHPERVRSLILQAPANPFCSRSRPQIRLFSSRLGQWLGRRIPHAPRRLQAIALERMYGDPARVEDGMLDNYLRSLRIPGTVDYVLSVLASWTRDMSQLKHLLRRLRGIPCLLLWGTHDRAVSLASGETLQRILGAELDLLPGLGHLPYEEQPHEFADRVSRFLASLGPLPPEPSTRTVCTG
jgi:pimeloyl-ACP methyl ester carboxylesterase